MFNQIVDSIIEFLLPIAAFFGFGKFIWLIISGAFYG